MTREAVYREKSDPVAIGFQGVGCAIAFALVALAFVGSVALVVFAIRMNINAEKASWVPLVMLAGAAVLFVIGLLSAGFVTPLLRRLHFSYSVRARQTDQQDLPTDL